MSSNLLKVGFTNLRDGEKRVIDTNALVASRIDALAVKMAQPENAGFMEDGEGFEDSGNGFSAGLSAARVEGLLSEDEADSGDESRGNVIKANPGGSSGGARTGGAERDRVIEDAAQEANQILAEARTRAQAEAQQLLSDARKQIAAEREEAIAEARELGYQEGAKRAQSELSAGEQELSERRRALEAEYEKLVDTLEPRFVDALTGVYEHLFGVELSSYREILVYLIGNAVRRIEGRDFLVHVSGEDYPYVSMEKKGLISALASPSATLELVEDSTLRRNECMIETEGGIFDCGLGAQLAELRQKLKLLSYEKPVP